MSSIESKVKSVKDDPKIYSVVVSYNGAIWILQCINSLLKSTVKNHSIIIIDNGSKDNTVQLVEKNFPEVHLVQPKANLGFGKANNLGIKIAVEKGADFVFLLNQDAWVKTNTLKKLVSISRENCEFGILSPLQYSACGDFDSQFEKYFKKSRFINDSINETKFVNAAGWLITRKCLEKVGMFSPLFFHYGEDADYCNRVIWHGFKIGIVKNTSYVHDRSSRSNEIIELNKQIQQVYTSSIVRFSNINHSLVFNILVSNLEILKKIGGVDNNLYLSKYAVLKGCYMALGKVLTILHFRKQSKSTAAYFLNPNK